MRGRSRGRLIRIGPQSLPGVARRFIPLALEEQEPGEPQVRGVVVGVEHEHRTNKPRCCSRSGYGRYIECPLAGKEHH
jgi:hypothetical protein